MSHRCMREHDEDDLKKPLPAWIAKKRSNPAEASEAVPCRKGVERDLPRQLV